MDKYVEGGELRIYGDAHDVGYVLHYEHSLWDKESAPRCKDAFAYPRARWALFEIETLHAALMEEQIG